MYLLDTNHCSRLILGDAPLARRVADAGEGEIRTCVIVAGELMDMAHRSERAVANLPSFRSFLEDIALYSVDEATAAIYGEFKVALFVKFGPKEKEKRRRFTLSQLGVGENDLWIASIALQHGLIVISADEDFTRLQQVQFFALENWNTP